MVTTKGATEVGITSATLNGFTDLLDLADVAEMGFLLSKTLDFSTTTKIKIDPNYGSVNKKVFSLESNQTYYYQFYVLRVSGSEETGGVSSFETEASSSRNLSFRPHLMVWRTPDGESGEDENGYPIPGIPGVVIEQDCRYHPSSAKMLKNEDSTDILQTGKIRLSKGDSVPHLWATIHVVDLEGNSVYSGTVKNRFVGQLSGGWVEV